MQESSYSAMSEARLNVRRLFFVLLTGVVLPICTALLIDLSLNTLPLVTIVALVVFLPFGAIWLSRVSLREFDRIVAEVAPEDELVGDQESPEGEPGVPRPISSSG